MMIRCAESPLYSAQRFKNFCDRRHNSQHVGMKEDNGIVFLFLRQHVVIVTK